MGAGQGSRILGVITEGRTQGGLPGGSGAGGWIRLSIDNTGGRAAVNSVSVKGGDGGDWKLLKNSWGATWEMSSAPAPPLSFKVGASASAHTPSHAPAELE